MRFSTVLHAVFLVILATIDLSLFAQNYDPSDDPKWLGYSRLTECEDWTRCGGNWAFQNHRTGVAVWVHPLTAKLHIREITDNTVIIDRVGPDVGFTAVYTGTLKDNVIQGEVVWTWPGHFPQPVHGHWLASADQGSLQAVLAAHFGPQLATLNGTWLANRSLTECENAKSCDGLWRFDNSVNGKANWTAQSTMADLKVTKISDTTVEIVRTGNYFNHINAVYSGTLKDGIVEGNVTWYSTDNGQQAHGHWYASTDPEGLRSKLGVQITAPKAPTQQASPRPPDTMIFCASSCFILTRGENGYYAGYKANEIGSAPVSTYSVEQFTTEAVTVNRTDQGGARAVVTGKIALDGSGLVHCQIRWLNAFGNGTAPCRLGWSGEAGEVKPVTSSQALAAATAPSTEYASIAPAVGSGPPGTITLDAKMATPTGIVVTGSGDIFVADGGMVDGSLPQTRRIMEVDPKSGKTRVIVDNSKPSPQASPFRSLGPQILVADNLGYLYTLIGSSVIRINEKTGAVTTINIIAPSETVVHQVNGVATVYADSGNHYIRNFDVDGAGNIYTAGDDGILKRSPNGQITKLADSKVFPASKLVISYNAAMDTPPDFLFQVSPFGDIYFSSPQESPSDRQIMKLSHETGKISVFSKQLPDQSWIVDPSGELICPCGSNIIRLSGDSQVAMPGMFSDHMNREGSALAIDHSGNLYQLSRDQRFQASIQKLGPVVR